MNESQFNDVLKLESNNSDLPIRSYVLFEGDKRITEVYKDSIKSVSNGMLIYIPGTSLSPASIDLSKITRVITRQ